MVSAFSACTHLVSCVTCIHVLLALIDSSNHRASNRLDFCVATPYITIAHLSVLIVSFMMDGLIGLRTSSISIRPSRTAVPLVHRLRTRSARCADPLSVDGDTWLAALRLAGSDLGVSIDNRGPDLVMARLAQRRLCVVILSPRLCLLADYFAIPRLLLTPVSVCR